MCSKFNNKEARTTSTVSLFLTLSLTLCIYILHDVKNAEMRAVYWKKEWKVSLTDCKLKFTGVTSQNQYD